jgi:hypothetical protein
VEIIGTVGAPNRAGREALDSIRELPVAKLLSKVRDVLIAAETPLSKQDHNGFSHQDPGSEIVDWTWPY